MQLNFIEYPKKIKSKVYDKTIKLVSKKLIEDKSVKSIYQIGHVKSPGISDLDLLVVYKDNESVLSNPRIWLSKQEKYIVTHNLFGVSEKDFKIMQNYSFFHNYKHIWGEKYQIGSNLKLEEQRILKKQIALEYLLQMYLVFTVQINYQIINLRGLLLHVNALKYDLELTIFVFIPL